MPVDSSGGRPPYAPDRFDWWEGERQPRSPRVTIREAQHFDAFQILGLAKAAGRHPKPASLARWLSQTGYCVRLACRNQRNAVAVCVTKTTPAGTAVLLLYVAPGYADLDVQLLRLAAHELPERPLTFAVPAADTATGDRLRHLGWKLVHSDGDDGDYTFSTGPVLRGRTGKAGKDDRQEP